MCMDLAAWPSGERAARPARSASDIRRLSATVILAVSDKARGYLYGFALTAQPTRRVNRAGEATSGQEVREMRICLVLGGGGGEGAEPVCSFWQTFSTHLVTHTHTHSHTLVVCVLFTHSLAHCVTIWGVLCVMYTGKKTGRALVHWPREDRLAGVEPLHCLN